MGWLGLKKRPGHDREDEGNLVQEEAGPLPPLTPVLNLLVPDIAGVTSFRLRQFLSVDEAADFVRSIPTISGLHAFWGLHASPPGEEDGGGNGEAMVLIRAAENSDTVYVVSFVDLDSALSFARFEVKRGMNAGLLLIYWAEIVDVQMDESGVRFSPDTPPPPGVETRAFEPILPPAEAVPAVEAAPPAETVPEVEVAPLAEAVPEVEVAPLAEAVPEVEATPLAEAVPEVEATPPAEAVPEVEAAPPEPEPVVLEETEVEEPLRPEPELEWKAETTEEFERETHEEFEKFVAEQEEARAVGEAAVEATLEPETAAEMVEPESIGLEGEQAAQAEPAAVQTEEEMDIEREAIAFLKASTNGKKPSQAAAEAETPSVEESAPEPAEPVVVAAEEPEPAFDPAPAAAVPPAETEPPEAQAPPPVIRVTAPGYTRVAEGEQGTEAEEDASEHLVEEVEKILKVKRWDKRESPFRGFDSPPGRF